MGVEPAGIFMIFFIGFKGISLITPGRSMQSAPRHLGRARQEDGSTGWKFDIRLAVF